MLGSLPNLESLTIGFPYRQEQVVPSNISLPADSFPAMKHLDLNSQSAEDVLQVWKIQPLVWRLASVAIKLGVSALIDAQACDLICTICQCSTQVTDLRMDFKPNSVRTKPVLLSSAAVASLRQLPLRRVQLTYARLGSDCCCEQLTMALSNLEYLYFPYQCFRFEDLALVAKHMPKLRFLGIRQNPETWPSEDQLHGHSPIAAPNAQTPPLYLELDFGVQALFMPQNPNEKLIDVMPKSVITRISFTPGLAVC